MRPTTITDVRTVSVAVTDQEAAVGFYVHTLGFESRLDALISPGRRWIEVAAPGADVSLALEAADPGRTATGSDTGVRFAVPDASAEHTALSAKGVHVGELLRWDGVPPMFSFDDPDGNRFYVVEDAR